MKKHILGLGILCLQLVGFGQSFQQIYGNTDNQQDLYAVEKIASDYFVGGTYRNYTTFPNLNFYGALSRLEPNGNRLWSKVYMPLGFQPMAGYFIRSVVNKGDTALLCVGDYSGSGNFGPGYCLFEANLNGTVSWAKLYSAQENPNEFSKLIPGNNCLYLLTSTKITRLDLNGNVLNAIAFQDQINDLKDLYVTASGSLVATGECALNNQFGSLVLQLEADLDFVNGFIYSANSSGFSAYEVAELSNNRFLVTGERFLMGVRATGQVEWAKLIQAQGNVMDSLYTVQRNWNLLPVNGLLNDFLLLNQSFFSDNSGNFQYYFTNYRVDELGTVSEARHTRTTPYDLNDNLSPGAVCLDTVSGEYIVVGNYTNSGDWHLNYLQKGALGEPGCGEEPTLLSVVDFPGQLIIQLFPSQAIIPASVDVVSLDLFTADLPVGLTNNFCTQLSIEETSATDFQLYPNPTTGELHLSSDHPIDAVRLRDVSGRLIPGCELSGTSLSRVDVLEPGTYFLEISSGSNVLVVSFKKV